MRSDRTEDVEEAASEWLIRRDSGDWTPLDQARLEEWLASATLNRMAFLRLELVWEQSARLKALGAGVSAAGPPPLGQWNLTPFFDAHQADDHPPPARLTAHRGRSLAIAASLVLAVLAGLGGYEHWDSDNDRYTTPVGGVSSMPLLDGSNMILNTNSQVRIELSKAERRIELRRGEAFFEVAKDPKRPFVVEAGRQRIVAVGTKFSVLRHGDSVEVVVTEGKVRLEAASQPSLGQEAIETRGNAARHRAMGPVLLTAGAIAVADGSGLIVQRKTVEDAETHLSWRSGVLMFRDLPLADAVAEFNRYNTRNILITDPAVAALRVEGNFRATNVDAFIRLLQSDFPIQIATDGDRIVLRTR